MVCIRLTDIAKVTAAAHTHLIAADAAELTAAFGANALRDAHGGDATRLRHDDVAVLVPAGAVVEDVLRHLGGFAAARRAVNDRHRIGVNRFKYLKLKAFTISLYIYFGIMSNFITS